MQKRFHAIITGRVQIVMYRDFVQRNARAEGLTGSVQNLSDGSVEVWVEGEEKSLYALVEKLKKGSLFSKVENIALSWLPYKESFSGFRIIYD